MLARGSEPQFPVSHMIMRVSKQYTYNHSIPRQPLVLIFSAKCNGLSPGGSVVKNLPANAGDTGDASSIPGLERSPGVGNGTHSSILAWKIPWAEKPDGLQSVGSQRVSMQ